MLYCIGYWPSAMMSTATIAPAAAATPSPPEATTKKRIVAIDALRGLVILLMLVDHAREFFFIHAQVADPMDVTSTEPALFLTRLTAHLCAPVFVALTGLSAWLYASRRGGTRAASAFLFKRGLFLIVLEVTVVNFAWTFSLMPETIYLQVIWAIGISMVVLAGLIHLPRPALIAVGITIVLGHNLLDPITIVDSGPLQTVWAIVHDRGFIDLPWGGQARTSYPVLPWIGVAALGYAVGPWFLQPDYQRQRRLVILGLFMIALFAVLRAVNQYGDPTAWVAYADPLMTAMSLLNLTKYPASADFLLLTLGIGTVLLVALERAPTRLLSVLALYGGAPLFFYIVHLYALHLGYQLTLAMAGPNHGDVFGVPNVGWIWIIAMATAVPLAFACRWFTAVKRQSGNPLLSYL